MKIQHFLFAGIAIIGLFFNTLAQLPSYIPTNGLVAAYLFNGNANDLSGNGNNGIVNGANLTLDRFFNANSAYYFNGSTNNIIVNNSPSLNFTNGITVTAWFKTSDPHVVGTSGMLIAKSRTNGSRNFFLDFIDLVNGGGDSIFFSAFNVSDQFFRSRVSASNLYTNKWHFIACTYDSISGNMKIFIDSSLKTVKQIGHISFEQVDIPLTLGCYLGVTSGYRNYYKGDIDDVFIYNKGLNDSLISQIYFSNLVEVEKNEINFKISVFPNPAFDNLFIDGFIGNNLQITDALGKVVINTINVGNVDVSSLCTGMYFINIKGEQKEFHAKVIVKR